MNREHKHGMILDVGCGANPQGDVNVELYPLISDHRAETINPRFIPNLVVADAHHLPFREDSFTRIIADNLLEHLERPLDAVREFSRVAQRLTVYVPYAPLRERREHLYSWTPDTLRNLLRKAYAHVQVTPTTRIKYIRRSRLLRLPILAHIVSRLLQNPRFGMELHAECRR